MPAIKDINEIAVNSTTNIQADPGHHQTIIYSVTALQQGIEASGLGSLL